MIEILAINKILQDKSLEVYKPLNRSYFPTMTKELDYILDHNREYGSVPDVETFRLKFPKFPIKQVGEPLKYIQDSLVENAVYTEIHPIAEEFAQNLTVDAVKATSEFIDRAIEVRKSKEIKRAKGVDIISSARDRYDNYVKRSENEDGIDMGFPEIDSVTGGMQSGDVITLYARPGKGKSWLGMYIGANAWKQGKKVLFYAGEMNEMMVGFRVDTFLSHISNMGMMLGKATIQDDYRKHTSDLAEKSGFIVVTPKDFNGSPTVDQIRNIVEEENIDVIILDQLSLMKDQRRGKDRTQRYGNIMEDIKLTAEELGKPFVVLAQAGRDAEKDKKTSDEVPQLHHIEYADLVGQHTVKAIGVNVIGKILKLGLVKTRFGKPVESLLKWDKDTGYITPLLAQDDLQDQAEDYGF